MRKLIKGIEEIVKEFTLFVNVSGYLRSILAVIDFGLCGLEKLWSSTFWTFGIEDYLQTMHMWQAYMARLFIMSSSELS